MNDDKIKSIDEQIKALEEEKKKLEDVELKKELKPSIKKIFEKDDNLADDEPTKEEVFTNYQIPSKDNIIKAEESIKSLSKLSSINLIVGLIISLVLFIVLSSDEAISYFLGIITSSFCYSILIRDSRNLAYIHISKYKSTMVKSSIKRMFVYIAVLFFVSVFEDQKDLSLIFTFLGIVTIKVITLFYFILKKGGIK